MTSSPCDFSAIPNSQTCTCSVWHYQVVHSTMHLKVYQPESDETYLLTFYGVEYFEGPMFWQSAAFHTEPVELALELLREKSVGWANIPDTALMVKFKLYVVQTPAAEIKILAEGCVLSRAPAAFAPEVPALVWVA